MLDVVAVERLHDARNVWLATVRSERPSHVAPVWFVYVEDRIWIGTGLTSVRVRNIRSNPAASACLEQGDEPVVAEGTALDVYEAARPVAVVEAFRTKYKLGHHDRDRQMTSARSRCRVQTSPLVVRTNAAHGERRSLSRRSACQATRRTGDQTGALTPPHRLAAARLASTTTGRAQTRRSGAFGGWVRGVALRRGVMCCLCQP